MKTSSLCLPLFCLVVSTACDSEPISPDAGAGGRPGPAGTGGTGGSGGSGGGAGSGGAGLAGSGGGGAGGGSDARRSDSRPADRAPGADAPGRRDGGPDGPALTILPPMAPPPGMGSCAAACSGLRAEYADALLRAQRCTVGAASPCGFKAPGSLGCGGCQVWVSDLTEVAPIANRFNQMGCYGCFFGGADGQNRCHAIGCPDLIDPVCTAGPGGQGSCTNESQRPCPAGVMTGAPCTRRPDQCMSGSGFCFCGSTTPSWTCFGS